MICSGIWTGICSAATGLELELPLLLFSSSRVSRIWREEEEEEEEVEAELPWPADV